MSSPEKNKIALWRNYERTENQPVAKGEGLIGEGNYHFKASMWESKKGTSASGKPWQVWNVSIQPAKDETRELVAVPKERLAEVMNLINGGVAYNASAPIPPPATPAQDEFADVVDDDMPF